MSGLATGASWLCYFRALQTGDVNKVVPIDKSSTMLTMLLAIPLLGEAVNAWKWAGMALIAGGTWLMIEGKDTASQEAKGRSWFFFAALAAVFASLTAILGKVGIQGVESHLGTAIRTAVVAVLAWAIVLGQGTHRQINQIAPRSWLFLGLSGLTTGLSWMCYYRALQQGPASVVVPVDKLSILVSVAFGGLVLKERLRARSIVGLGLIVAGTLCLLMGENVFSRA